MATLYELEILKNTWWVSTDRRIFLVAEIRATFNEELKAWEPQTIGLLEQFSEEVVYRPWSEFCKFYDNLTFKRPSIALREEYKTKHLIKL